MSPTTLDGLFVIGAGLGFIMFLFGFLAGRKAQQRRQRLIAVAHYEWRCEELEKYNRTLLKENQHLRARLDTFAGPGMPQA